jgi:O-antigen/teichoic acid export membrane protein
MKLHLQDKFVLFMSPWLWIGVVSVLISFALILLTQREARQKLKLKEWFSTLLFLTIVTSLALVLILAALEPIYSTPIQEWVPLLIFCISISTVWTALTVKTRNQEIKWVNLVKEFLSRTAFVVLIAIVAILIFGFFAWNGGAPLDDVEPINPADIDFP